jgi:hypothetical protein
MGKTVFVLDLCRDLVLVYHEQEKVTGYVAVIRVGDLKHQVQSSRAMDEPLGVKVAGHVRGRLGATVPVIGADQVVDDAHDRCSVKKGQRAARDLPLGMDERVLFDEQCPTRPLASPVERATDVNLSRRSQCRWSRCTDVLYIILGKMKSHRDEWLALFFYNEYTGIGYSSTGHN